MHWVIGWKAFCLGKACVCVYVRMWVSVCVCALCMINSADSVCLSCRARWIWRNNLFSFSFVCCRSPPLTQPPLSMHEKDKSKDKDYLLGLHWAATTGNVGNDSFLGYICFICCRWFNLLLCNSLPFIRSSQVCLGPWCTYWRCCEWIHAFAAGLYQWQ